MRIRKKFKFYYTDFKFVFVIFSTYTYGRELYFGGGGELAQYCYFSYVNNINN